MEDTSASQMKVGKKALVTTPMASGNVEPKPNQEPPSQRILSKAKRIVWNHLTAQQVGGKVRVGDSQARRTTHDGVGHARDLANESSMDHVPSIVQDKRKAAM